MTAARRRMGRDRLAAGAVAVALVALAIRYQDVRVAVGALLGYVVLLAVVWTVAVRLIRAHAQTRAELAPWRVRHVPEPPSNLLYATTTDTRRPDASA